MKKIVVVILFCAFATITKAQNSKVEKSITGIQTGFLGVWIYNEYKITHNIALRSEIGLNSGFKDHGVTDFLMAPVFTIEPRTYYNIGKREAKKKNVKNNSANFFALTAKYNPDWFVISNNTNENVPNQILIAPKWGIRRGLGAHFNYELGVGLGIRSYFGEKIGSNGESTETAADVHLRIGYTF